VTKQLKYLLEQNGQMNIYFTLHTLVYLGYRKRNKLYSRFFQLISLGSNTDKQLHY
jgi:hypothetical protein